MKTLAIAITLLLGSANLAAQVEALHVPVLERRAREHGMVAFDPTRLVTVLLLDEFTWEWNGTAWLRHNAGPSAGSGMGALTHDAARGRVVFFGGDINTPSTSQWDGQQWTSQWPPVSPPARRWFSMAYHAPTTRVVLFGGEDVGSIAPLADTWEWDGTSWQRRFPTTIPPARRGHTMAYDSVRGVIVLFGGQAGNTMFGDTWEWDGTNWALRAPITSPPPRVCAAMAFDAARGRTLLFGGAGPPSPGNDTWEWDGAQWTQLTPAQSPGGGSWFYEAFGMTHDAARGRCVLVRNSETWEWNGVTWTQREWPAPAARRQASAAYDNARDRLVVFGGHDSGLAGETWEWDGLRWWQHRPSLGPAPRRSPAFAFDPARGRSVLFGGDNFSGLAGDTWEWDGTRWLPQLPVTTPPPTAGRAAVFDPVRNRVLLVSGSVGVSTDASTWEWDGTNWTRRVTATAPVARIGHAVAFDRARGRAVLFGGRDARSGNRLTDTWEWDGSNWLRRTPVVSPPGVDDAALAYDERRQRTVAWNFFDAWEWDGNEWLRRVPAGGVQRTQVALAFDARRGTTILYGGNGNIAGRGSTWPAADLWQYGAVNPASYTALGTGCSGTAGTPALAPTPGNLPWLGDSFTLRVRNLPATAPVVYLFGNSNTAWGSLTLPADLTPIGMNGCVLRAAGIVTLPMLNQAGTASITFAVPSVRYLVRAPFYDQAFALDQQANPFGATLSNAGELRFGER